MISTSKINAFTKFLAVVLFGGALLIFSINTLKAENNNKTFNFPETLTENDTNLIQASNGKYQMSLDTYKGKDNDIYWIILVWDTQTGKSKLYHKNNDKGTVPSHNGWQLPASPL
jgi:hypothetical protein